MRKEKKGNVRAPRFIRTKDIIMIILTLALMILGHFDFLEKLLP